MLSITVDYYRLFISIDYYRPTSNDTVY